MKSHSQLSDSATVSAQSVVPALAGAAIGLILGARLKGENRNLVASGLIAGAFLAIVPPVVERIRRDYYLSPESRRGAQRHLDKIRMGASANADQEVYDDQTAERYRA